MLVRVWYVYPSACKRVSIRVSTTNLRVKQMSDSEIVHEFPLFRVSYCGTDVQHKEVFR